MNTNKYFNPVLRHDHLADPPDQGPQARRPDPLPERRGSALPGDASVEEGAREAMFLLTSILTFGYFWQTLRGSFSAGWLAGW